MIPAIKPSITKVFAANEVAEAVAKLFDSKGPFESGLKFKLNLSFLSNTEKSLLIYFQGSC